MARTPTLDPLDAIKKRIRAACRAKLSAYKLPTKVILSDTLLYTVRHKKSRRA
jgi:hypothetical protein